MTSPPARLGMAARITIVTTAVALTAVLITGLVSAGLIRGAARSQELTTLQRFAQIAAGTVDTSGRLVGTGLPRFASRLQITAARISPAGVVRPLTNAAGFPAGVVELAAAGSPFTTTATVGARDYLFAGEPVAAGELVLREPASAAAEVTGPLRRRLLLALLIGLGVAVLAGALLANRLVRPLRAAAAAAHRLATGNRDVRLQPEGPAEVDEVSDALNLLAGALAASEGRQRQFLVSVSHELRTPLTAVKGYAEALSDGVVAPEQVAATGRTMLTEAERLERLVSDLLDLARLGADDFRIDLAYVDLTDLMQQAASVWSARVAAERLTLRADLPGEPLVVVTDGTRVRQIVDGLAENALRVTPAGAPIVFALRADGGSAVIEVRDGGPGLTDEDLSVAFERSALYDRYRGVRRVGTGVGLALVAGLAARLGGSAEAGHAPEGGARFTIRLPLDPAGYPPATLSPSATRTGRPAA